MASIPTRMDCNDRDGLGCIGILGKILCEPALVSFPKRNIRVPFQELQPAGTQAILPTGLLVKTKNTTYSDSLNHPGFCYFLYKYPIFNPRWFFFFLMNQVEIVSGLGFSVYVIPCSQKQFMAA